MIVFLTVVLLCFASSSSFSLIFFVFHPSPFFLRSCSIFALLLFRWSSWLESLAPYFLLTLSCSAFSYFSSLFLLLRDFLPALSLYSFPVMILACLSMLFFFFFFFVFRLPWLSTVFASPCFFVFFISQSCRLRFPMHALFRDIRRPIAPFTVIRHSMLPSQV